MSTANEQEQKQEQQEVRVPCLVYSRVVGYLTPTQNWNKGKRQEWNERKTYHVPGSGDREQVPGVRTGSDE